MWLTQTLKKPVFLVVFFAGSSADLEVLPLNLVQAESVTLRAGAKSRKKMKVQALSGPSSAWKNGQAASSILDPTSGITIDANAARHSWVT
jgi:hypothetical protein